MGKNNKDNKMDIDKCPFVTICTPTFNRRPFIPMLIQCFEHQTYPKNKIEWIIVDDGTDKIEDLVKHIPQVRYLKFDEKLTLGKKRNISNENATGEIIIYMDDDDYYPPDRISHAVDKLKKNTKALCAGSSAMYIYFNHIKKMYQFGPYGSNHSTAATFAFKRELLKQTKFDESSCVAEEKKFLKDYTIPFVQLEPSKSILVFSHNHNSFDKKELLKQLPNPCIHETMLQPCDLIKEPNLLKFFMEDVHDLLNEYEPGKLENKPDVEKQLIEIKEKREKMIEEHKKQQEQQHANNIQNKFNEQTFIIQQLYLENNQLKDKVNYLEDKIKQLITEKIKEIKSSKPEV